MKTNLTCLFTIISSCIFAQCDSLLLHDDYSDSTLWTPAVATPGTVTISGGTLNYNHLHGSDYGRVYRSLPAVLPDTYWNATCDLMPVSGNGPGHYVMAFTAGTLDPISYDGSSSYSLTNQDAIVVYYLYQGGTPTSGTCCTDPDHGPWQVVIRSKKGNLLALPSAGISILSLNKYSYVKLERLSKAAVSLHVYSDSAMVNDLPGSPVFYCVDSSITGLNTVQQGVVTWSGYNRVLTAQLDNLNVCLSKRSDTTRVSACISSDAILQAGNIPLSTYIWSPAIACNTCAQATVPAPLTGISNYSVQINSPCSVLNEYFSVSQNTSCHDPCLTAEIPNVFTPNDDMINDKFIINGCYQGLLKIYNRWGQIVFKTTDFKESWNGKIMNTGRDVPDGTYYFIITDAEKTKTGYVAVIR